MMNSPGKSMSKILHSVVKTTYLFITRRQMMELAGKLNPYMFHHILI